MIPELSGGPPEPDWNILEGAGDFPLKTKMQTVPLLRKGDRSYPQVTEEVDSKILNLKKPEDLEEYKRILALCLKNKGRMLEKHIEYDAREKSWRVFITWTVGYLMTPEESRAENRTLYK